jgi:hypothetical protein
VDAVDAVVVEVVLEAGRECADEARSRAALDEALRAARAPARGRGSRTRPSSHHGRWTVTMTVAPNAGGSKSVDAVIVDDAGTIVARRTLADRTASRSCLPLARGVGAWAALVLDAELAHAKDDDGPADAPVAAPAPRGDAPVLAGGPWSGRETASFGGDGGDGGDADDLALPRAARRSIEVGMMVYLRNGMTTTGGFAGLAPFVTIEVSNGWVLRPELLLGRSTSPLPVGGEASGFSHAGLRADFCRRIQGNYLDRRGIELDLCAGIEGGIITADASSARVREASGRLGTGPSATLRGELGAGAALEVRGVAGANLLAFAPETPLVFAAIELGASMRFP